MSNTSLSFTHPWLLIIIPIATALSIVLYFLLNKRRRKEPNLILSIFIQFLVITLLTSVAAGIHFDVTDAPVNNDVVFLVDASASEETVKEQMNEYLESEIEMIDEHGRVGFVTFGKKAEVAAPLNKDPKAAYQRYLSYTPSDNVRNATNIEEAIRTSIALFDGKNDKRIIILTDGVETDGSLYENITQFKDSGIEIDAVYFPSLEGANDMQLDAFVLPDNVKINRDFTAKISILSNYAARGTLQIFDNEVQIFSEQVDVRRGLNELSITLRLTSFGEHSLHAQISAPTDGVPENNNYYGYFELSSENKILILDGTGSESTKLKNLLEESYQIDVKAPSEVAGRNENLNEYGEVIAMNVDIADFPSGFTSNLRTYVNGGGGLLTTGGDNTYHFGNMDADPLISPMLPIDTKLDENAPVAILLMIDKSSSMREMVAGKTRLEFAKESAVACVNSLRDYDYVGVITFDANPTLVCPMTLVSQKATIIQRINSIELGYGTAYAEAFKMANNQLVGFDDVLTKHIIFISDGEPVDSGYKERLAYIRAKGVTASFIGVGSGIQMDTLETLAAIGGGTAYPVSDPSQLTPILIAETESLKGKYINEGTDITPRIAAHNQVTEGILSVPALSGYNGAEIKEDALMILAYESDPIYATMPFGAGKVGSFTCDLNGTNSANYFEDSRGIAFIENAVKDLFSPVRSRRTMTLRVKENNFGLTIEATTVAMSVEDTSLNGILTLPDNTTQNIEFAFVTRNTFRYSDPEFFLMPGVYRFEVIRVASGTETRMITHFVFSYSKEFDMRIRNSEHDNLAEFCVQNNGRLFNQDESVFKTISKTMDYSLDPRVVLLAIAITLFVFNVAIRKFRFRFRKKGETA